MKPTVGFIGLGLMGRPMAANLLKAGYALTVWNRTAARADELVAAGAQRAANPRAVAAAADIVFTMVSDPPALEAVLWGEDGVFAGLRAGSILIDSSTVSPALAIRVAAAAAQKNAEFLEAPVTGGTWGAEKGELVFMIGGDKKTLTKAEPVLNVLGRRRFHLGAHGAGQTVKVAMNLILALQVQAFAEALALVRREGIGGENLLEILQSSMGRSGLVDIKAPLMLKGEYPPSFPLRLMHKDLGLALDLANRLGVPLPATAAARETYGAVKDAGQADADYAAVAAFWQKK